MSEVKRQNITIDPEAFEDFCKYAGRKGIKISTWGTMKMREFVEEEKALEELKKSNLERRRFIFEYRKGFSVSFY
ncbi:hypothetical protein [Clostridium kluyveri]|uniref:Uncharacterized protein n=1 Tax=Clostridium kluyveri TaxID=1534 RepID=A0A1L5F3Z5_CLOKL|nr:hypothetical protein [Clostridium kluyveri]APM37741.1 hypothetical protein BS101_02760 [Clostridium kluyveri]UZQ52758.1 hypothetical protein OP486_08780 [Clostridium kluyveri]